MLRNSKVFGGRTAHISKKHGLEDAAEDLLFNLSRLATFLEKIFPDVPGDGFSEREQKRFSDIAKNMKPVLTKYIMEQARGPKAADDTDTQLQIDVYLSHYDRNPHSVEMRTSQCMKLSNLLMKHATKLRLNQTDSVQARVCVSLSLSISIYLSINPSIYPSIHPSIYLSIYISLSRT